jgi:hypothetical protein
MFPSSSVRNIIQGTRHVYSLCRGIAVRGEQMRSIYTSLSLPSFLPSFPIHTTIPLSQNPHTILTCLCPSLFCAESSTCRIYVFRKLIIREMI